MAVIQNMLRNIMQIPGWRSNRHIIVFESDDWGSIRMPSLEIYQDLLARGLAVDKCLFSKYDSLERSEDLAALYEIMHSVKDKNGHPAVVTADCIVANPDFDRIEQSGFTQYHYEKVTDTFSHYTGCENSYSLYQQGMNDGVWHPQFHGREHLNVRRWMTALQQNDEVTLLAFKQRHFGLSNKVSPKLKVRFMDAFANVGEDHLIYESEIIREGTNLFEELFGYRSKSIMAPCYTWRKDLESIMLQSGIKYLQGLPIQQVPVQDEPIICKSKYHYMGQKNELGQRYLMRNVFFEPYKGNNQHLVDECLSRIKTAFRWNKPAIISTHRLNFIGTMDIAHRDISLILLKELLSEIVNRWSDVEFCTSDQLGEIMDNE